MMRFVIVGFGSIGRRHLQSIKSVYPKAKVSVLRQKTKSGNLGGLNYLVDEVFFDINKALAWKPDAVVIANPAPFHVSTALKFAKANVHLFVEKPLSDSLKGIDALIKECKKRNLILAVGYVLRFHESLKILKKAIERGRIGRVLNVRASAGQSLLNWRPGADYRKGVSAQRELGGGIVFELSHEIDYCRWLMGEISEVSAIIDKQSDLAIDVEDVAEINLRFKNGVIGHIHLDMVDQARNRCCRIVGTKGTLAWDFMDNHSVKLCSIGQKRWVNLRKPQAIDANDMFCRQFGHFRQCIDSKKSPLVSGEDAKRVVEIILAAKKSARKGITVRV